MENGKEQNLWYSIPKGKKILFLNPDTNRLYTRYDFERIEQAFEQTGVYLVKLKLSRKYAIYNANRNELSPKFDKFVSTHDYVKFVVEKHSITEKYQTIYDLNSNRLLDVKSDSLIEHIANSDTFKVHKTRNAKNKDGKNFGTENCYEIFNSKNGNNYGEFGYVSSEALLDYIYVRDGSGWSSKAYILNLTTGKKIDDKYHADLYRAMQSSQDDQGINQMSTLSTFSYEHLFYCLPELKEVCEKEHLVTKKPRSKPKANEEELERE